MSFSPSLPSLANSISSHSHRHSFSSLLLPPLPSLSPDPPNHASPPNPRLVSLSLLPILSPSLLLTLASPSPPNLHLASLPSQSSHALSPYPSPHLASSSLPFLSPKPLLPSSSVANPPLFLNIDNYNLPHTHTPKHSFKRTRTQARAAPQHRRVGGGGWGRGRVNYWAKCGKHPGTRVTQRCHHVPLFPTRYRRMGERKEERGREGGSVMTPTWLRR